MKLLLATLLLVPAVTCAALSLPFIVAGTIGRALVDWAVACSDWAVSLAIESRGGNP